MFYRYTVISLARRQHRRVWSVWIGSRELFRVPISRWKTLALPF
jgi:hypothetical protein